MAESLTPRQRVYNKERILTKDLDYIQSTKERAIADRQTDWHTAGIVPATHTGLTGTRLPGVTVAGEFLFYQSGATFSVGSYSSGGPVTLSSTSLGGLAYDGLGRRIYIDANVAYNATTSIANPVVCALPAMIQRSTGNTAIPIPVGPTYYIWIEYYDVHDQSVDSRSLDKDGVAQLSRMTAGYRILFDTTHDAANPYTDALTSIYLGSVTLSSGMGMVFDYAGRMKSLVRAEDVEIIVDSTLAPTSYGNTQVHTLLDHVNALGTNTTGPTIRNPHNTDIIDIGGLTPISLSEHRSEQHSPGVIVADRTLTTSGLYPGSVSTLLKVLYLASGEYLYTTGERYDLTGQPLSDGDVYSAYPAVTSVGLVSGGGTGFEINFLTAGTVPISGSALPANYYVIYVAAGVVNAAETISANLQTTIDAIEADGHAVIASIYWDGANPIVVTDLRRFGSISSKDLQPADGLTAQDVSIGTGVKTGHLQDSAVTVDKTDYHLRGVNQTVFQSSALTSNLSITFQGPSDNAYYTMDGFYSQWLGGFVRQDLNGVASGTDGRLLRLPVPRTATMPIINAGGENLDVGNLARPNTWYAVYAVEDYANPGQCVIRFTPFIRVLSATTASPVSRVLTSAHLGVAVSNVNYGWGGAYAGGTLIALSGAAAGRIYPVLASGVSGATYLDVNNSAAPLIQAGDWLAISPAASSGVVVRENFRYVGAIQLEGTYLKHFSRLGNVYQSVVESSVTTSPTNINSTVMAAPPTAVSFGGSCQIDCNNALGAAQGSVGASAGGWPRVYRFLISTSIFSPRMTAPFPLISMLHQGATSPYKQIHIDAPVGTTITAHINAWEE